MHFFVLIINVLRITVVVVKVYNPQRTFDLDQSLWPTTSQNLGMRQVPLKLPQGKKFALFPENPISSGHNSPKYRTEDPKSRYVMHLQPNLLGTEFGVLLSCSS